MKFGLRASDIKTLKKNFKKYPQIKETRLFGSRAMGNYKKGSDIDLVVKGGLNFSLLAKIKNQLEETSLPYFFDVLSYEDIQNKDLKKHIDKFGKLL